MQTPIEVAPGGRDLFFFCLKSQCDVVVQLGGWIVAELDGEGFYPCTADDFDVIYERVGAYEETT